MAHEILELVLGLGVPHLQSSIAPRHVYILPRKAEGTTAVSHVICGSREHHGTCALCVFEEGLVLVFGADRDWMREASGELGVLAKKAGNIFSPNAKLNAMGNDGKEGINMGLIGSQGAKGDDDEFAVVEAHVFDPVECHDKLELWAIAGLVPSENKLGFLE
jgi:hypothetical protein